MRREGERKQTSIGHSGHELEPSLLPHVVRWALLVHLPLQIERSLPPWEPTEAIGCPILRLISLTLTLFFILFTEELLLKGVLGGEGVKSRACRSSTSGKS
jgi:hypothetical protein